MALMKKTQRSFSGGQIDKDLTGRQDLNKYSQGCLVLENFKVRKQGNIVKRAGTDLVCDFTNVLNNTTISNARIIPIVQERDYGFYMLFTAKKAFLLSPEGLKMMNGSWSRSPSWDANATWSVDALPEGVAFSGQPTYSSGTWTWADTSSHSWTATGSEDAVELEFSYNDTTITASYGNDASHTVPYSIDIPFDDSDLRMLDWCQSGDTIFFAHRSYPPCKIVYDNGKISYERLSFRQASGKQPIITSVTGQGTWGTGPYKEVEYCVTAVKDGIESAPSPAYGVSYNMPWGNTCSLKITVDTSRFNEDEFDCFYIYKKESDVFGLIGTTSNQTTFVSISNGFSVNGNLYPSGYGTFDKQVHLRDSEDNKFASVSKVTSTITTKKSTTWLVNDGRLVTEVTRQDGNIKNSTWYKNRDSSTTTTSGGTTYSSSAQKGSSSTFTYNIPSTVLTSLKLRIGGLEHCVAKNTINETEYTWGYKYSSRGYWRQADLNTPLAQTAISPIITWTSSYTEFTASLAKFYKATLYYYNGGTEASIDVNCVALVDQTQVGVGWTQVAGSSNRWRKTYDSPIVSYDDAATVIARMDNNQPSVGATVTFKIPAADQGKSFHKIVINGYTDNGMGTSATFIANGISCYQEGKFVNSFTDDYITPDLTITPPKTEDHFVSPNEYPACVQLYSQRLCYASSVDNPFTFWMSCTGDLYNFDKHEYIRASDAITASTAALEMPRINRMLVHRDLMMFADGGEWQVAPSSGNAVSPSTIAAKLQSAIGCAAWVKPIAIEGDIIYCDRSGENLYSTKYNFASDGYESNNLSVLSQRIFRNNPIKALAYAQFPESTIECVLNDGTIASLVYMKEHDVCAWSVSRLGGDYEAFDIATNKSMRYGSSSIGIVAKRTYEVENDGTSSQETVWSVLGLRDIDPDDRSLKACLRMDAVRYVETSRSGDDIVQPDMVDGEIAVRIGVVKTTVDDVTTVTGDKFAVGIPFTSTMKTTSPEFTDQETAQMEIKNCTESEVRVIDGSDFTVRQEDVVAAKATTMKVPCVITEEDEALFTCDAGDADCRMIMAGNNSRNGSVVIEHSGHLPLSILSVTTTFDIEYSNHPPKGGSADA